MPKKLTLAVVFLTPLVSLFAYRGTVILLILLALLGLWAERGRCLRLPRPHLWLWLMGAFLAWAAASALWAYTPGLALPKTGALALLALAGFITLGYFRTMDDDMAGKAVTALVIALVTAALIQAVEARTGRQLFATLHWLGGTRVEPPHGFPLPKPAATLCAIWAVLCASVCWSRGWYKRAVVAVAAALLLAWTVTSNAGLLALAVGLSVAAAGRLAPRAVGVTMILVVMAGFASGPLAARLPDTFDIARAIRNIPTSGMHRLAIWHFTGQRIVERPVLGWGMDASRALPGGEDDIPVTLRYTDRPMTPETNCETPLETCIKMQQPLPLHPHNFVLQVWVELGAVGAVLFAAMIVMILRACVHGRPATAASALATAAAALMVACTGYGIWQAWWLAALWFTAALAAPSLRPLHPPEAETRTS